MAGAGRRPRGQGLPCLRGPGGPHRRRRPPLRIGRGSFRDPVRICAQNVDLRSTLDALTPRSPTEASDLAAVRRVLEDGGDPWRRDTPLHVTCSAVVVHAPTRRVLLRWHRRQQAWLQVGGHADPGEVDPFAVALREAVEETGLPDLRPWPDPDAPVVVHLAVVPVPAAGNEPSHEHADLRYVLATDRPDDVAPESPDAPLRWLELEEANALTAEDNLRETLSRIDFAL